MAHTAVRAIIVQDDKLLVMKRNKFGMEYYTLVGGGVNIGENAEMALRRELQGETGMQVGAMRLVYTEDAGAMYGLQHIFLCQYISGEPQLSPESEEAIISKMGQNLYLPMWLPVSELPQTPLRSDSVKQAILRAFKDGFPQTPEQLAWKPEDMSSLEGKT